MAMRYSEAQKDNDSILLKNAQILILDCIGKLSAAYRYGSVAFIGGGFTGNLHNILEPAVYGLSILFGPKHAKFPEAKMFLQQGFAREVGDSTALLSSIRELLDSQEELSEAIQAFISSQQGGSQRILEGEANKNHSFLK
jgi:3-deoxy-D-manno-octulosonic-acid transferase